MTTHCTLCGEPMPEGEEMFRYHGHSGPCPKKKEELGGGYVLERKPITPLDIPTEEWDVKFRQVFGEYAEHKRLDREPFVNWAIKFIISLLDKQRDRLELQISSRCAKHEMDVRVEERAKIGEIKRKYFQMGGQEERERIKKKLGQYLAKATPNERLEAIEDLLTELSRGELTDS